MRNTSHRIWIFCMSCQPNSVTVIFIMWKYHGCYGYIIRHAFHTNKNVSGFAFQWCLHSKSNITWPLRDMKFLFWCWKINVSWGSDIWRENFVSLCWDKRKSKRFRGNLVKSHHLRHHTEAVCKILKTSYIVYFQKISIPYLEGNECCW